MKYEYYQLKETFEEEIRNFFSIIFGFRLKYDIRILEDNGYDKRCGKRSAACIEKTVVKGDPKSVNLLLQMDHLKRTICIRIRDQGVSVESITHEILHGYFPKVKEKHIKQATPIFATAFLCYDALYNEQALRDFFLELCRDGHRLQAWSGLPKFETSKTFKDEEKMINVSRGKQEEAITI